MMKIAKYALLALAALALVVIGVAGYIAATFDAKEYVPRIVELVKEKTGRTLTVAGDVRLSFWPDVGVQLGACRCPSGQAPRYSRTPTRCGSDSKSCRSFRTVFSRARSR